MRSSPTFFASTHQVRQAPRARLAPVEPLARGDFQLSAGIDAGAGLFADLDEFGTRPVFEWRLFESGAGHPSNLGPGTASG